MTTVNVQERVYARGGKGNPRLIGWSSDGHCISSHCTSQPSRAPAPRTSHKPSYYIDPSAVPKTVRRLGTIVRRIDTERRSS